MTYSPTKIDISNITEYQLMSFYKELRKRINKARASNDEDVIINLYCTLGMVDALLPLAAEGKYPFKCCAVTLNPVAQTPRNAWWFNALKCGDTLIDNRDFAFDVDEPDKSFRCDRCRRYELGALSDGSEVCERCELVLAGIDEPRLVF